MTDSSSMSSLALWDLAPGEDISQSPPTRAVQDERTLPCPGPTLDTEGRRAGELQNRAENECLRNGFSEFLAQNAYYEDCSSLDSLAEFGLAPGEVRSQSPFRTFHGSQLPQGPPPTLDTQEFEINIKSEEMWIVEDSLASGDLALGECRSRGPVLDMPNSSHRFCPPALDTQEFENNRLISDDVWRVEDSLPGWDSALGEARSEGPCNHFNDFKSLDFRSSTNAPGFTTADKNQKAVPLSNSTPVNCILEAYNYRKMGSNLVVAHSTSVAKRSLPPTSPHRDSGQSHKQVKLDPGANFSDDPDSLLLPAPSTERSICGESHRKGSTLRDTENSRKQNVEVAQLENFGLGPLSSPKHKLLETVSPPISDIKLTASNVEKVLHERSYVTRFTLTDVTNSRVFAAKSPTKSNFDKRSCLSERHAVVLANKAGHVTNPLGYPSKNRAISESPDEGHRMEGTEVDGKSLGEKPGSGCQAIDKLQTSLGFESATTSRKLGMQDDGPDTEGWLCPRDGKKFRPTSKQLSLDRWIR